MGNVITLENLKLTLEFLSWNETKREEVCKRIIEESIKKMTVKVSREVKVKTMIPIFQRSIERYESLEEYENCEILNQIKKVLEKELV